jgi:hypothetical protein
LTKHHSLTCEPRHICRLGNYVLLYNDRLYVYILPY